MIHTLTIQHKLSIFQINSLFSRLHFSQEKRDTFFFDESDRNIQLLSETKYGFDKVYCYRDKIYDRTVRHWKTLYILYIRMEPLAFISGERHVSLFECTEDNINRLCNKFTETMGRMLYISSDDDILADLTDFKTWEAQRVDYTYDIKFSEEAEVKAFINLAKLSCNSSGYTKIKSKSTYGKSYSEPLIYGNKTWELAIYNKEGQIKDKQSKQDDSNQISDTTYKLLLEEAKNVVRLEYRKLTRGTTKASTHFETRNIMEFMTEQRANEWLYACYGSAIGFEDWVNTYNATQILAENYPMSFKQEQAYKRELSQARKEGKKQLPTKISIEAKKLLDFMNYVSIHRGKEGAIKAALAEAGISPEKDGKTEEQLQLEKKKVNAIKAKFKYNENKIRSTGMSPILIPHRWQGSKKYSHGILINPVSRPEQYKIQNADDVSVELQA